MTLWSLESVQSSHELETGKSTPELKTNFGFSWKVPEVPVFLIYR